MEVVHNLYIGDNTIALDSLKLRDVGIKYIVSISTSFRNVVYQYKGFEYINLIVDGDISKHFEDLNNWISERIYKGKVLIHCKSLV